MSGIGEEGELQCQTAFLLCRAVDEPDPIAALKDNLTLHNLTEYNIHESGPLKALIALSSDSIKVAAGVKTSLNVRPTVFIAFGNSLQHPNHDAPGKASLGMLLAAQRPCGFPGVEGHQVHGNALAVLESMPMGTILSLLGQGFKLVTTGYKFGGVVAHLFAAKLLLQLNQEVQMAKQMGIDLSMSLADNKISSFAFASPYFATHSMAKALATLELGAPGCGHTAAGSLHTIWRANDASVPFFTAASELFTVAATTAAESVPSAAAASGGDQASPSLSPEESTLIAVRLMRSPQVSSIQEWCRHVAENVDGYGRCKASTTSRLLARPLDVSLLARVCAPGGLPNTPANPDAAGLANLRLGSGTLDADCHSPSGPRAPAAARGGPVGASPARRRRSIEMPDPAAVAAGIAAPSPTGRGPAARRRSMELLDPVAMAAMEALGSGGSFTGPAGEGAAPAARARRASLLLGDGSSGKAGKGAAPAAPVRFNSWKEALSHLMQVMGDGLGERFSPIGQVWVLGAPPAASGAASDDAARTKLQGVDHPKALQMSAGWLSPANSANLFLRWEVELDELQKDLMNAFAWVSFRDCVEMGGAAVHRGKLLRKSPNLSMSA